MPVPTSAQLDELRQLIRSGNKVEAVKQFRNIADVGLTEALAAMNAMESSGGAAASNVIAPKALKEAESAALAAIRKGNLFEAIKRYSKHAKVDLVEAKHAVDALDIAHRSSGRVNAKLARALLTLVNAGQKQDAITQLVSQVGFEESEAKTFLATIKSGSAASAGSRVLGCLAVLGLIVLAVTAALTLLR